MREDNNEARAHDALLSRQYHEPVFPKQGVRQDDRIHGCEPRKVLAARDTETLYVYQEGQVGERGGADTEGDREVLTANRHAIYRSLRT